MRIVFVVSGSADSASPRYRARHLADALTLTLNGNQGGAAQTEVVSLIEPYSVSLRSGDIIVLHRIGFAGPGERFLNAARRVGAVVVWSTDDLIFTPDFAHQIGLHFPDDPVRYRQHSAAVDDFRRMLCACDAALVSTEYLSQQAHWVLAESRVTVVSGITSTPPVFVIRNFLSEKQLLLAESAVRTSAHLLASPVTAESETITLAYLSGSATHDVDLSTIAVSLAAVLSRFPQTRLLLVGPVTLPPALRPLADAGRILRHTFVPWQDLPGLFTYCRVDINLAPLDASRPFIHAKSEVKFLEAAAVRIPTIASPAAGFAEGVRDGKDCLLAANPADWERLLSDLAQKPGLRRSLGEAAEEALQARGTIAANAENVQSVLAQMARLTPKSPEVGFPREQVCWVRPILRERLLRTAKKGEQGLMGRFLRLSRHIHRLREDMGGG